MWETLYQTNFEILPTLPKISGIYLEIKRKRLNKTGTSAWVCGSRLINTEKLIISTLVKLLLAPSNTWKRLKK
jgi:hypothetical protein